MSDLTSAGGAATPPAPGTLGQLVDGIGGTRIRLLVAPAGLGAPVSGTVIHDPGDPLPPSPAAVLLLVGSGVGSASDTDVLRGAAEAGFTAVVVKRRGQDAQRFLDEARSCGVAVLAADDELPWRSVDATLSCTLASFGSGALTGSAPPGSVPAAGGELFELADALAVVVGGSVAIEDLDQNVIAYSKLTGVRIDAVRERGILQRRVPDMPEQRRQYRQVLAAAGPVRFPAMAEELPRAAVAIRAGTLPLGTLWAIEPEQGLTAKAGEALVEAARLAAPHLLQALNLPEAERRMRRDTLRAVLNNAGPPPDEAAEALGLRPGTRFCLAVFAPGGGQTGAAGNGRRGAADAALLTHAESVLTRHCAAHRADATVAATAGAVYVLLSAAAPGVGRRFAEGALVALRRAAGEDVRAAVTRPYDDLGRAAALRREADAILRATAGRGRKDPVATTADVRHRILLDRLGDELERDPWLRLSEIDELLEHDRTGGTDYAATAVAWLDALGDIATAAARLKVHPNTLRHRLRRIRELFRVDLDDPDVRLAAWLELRRAAESGRAPRPAAAPAAHHRR
ncbi:PucR family transcriptional regulator [Streptomyces sp. NPDC091376]|uniref:PucR family transcriptional regulator n=1 Tax=Streptomyces sp. NPDC091376 TaxID=3365994 RepID=UPI0037F97E43